MASMEHMMGSIFDKRLATQYPHLRLPPIKYARVTGVSESGGYKVIDIVIHNLDTKTQFNAEIDYPSYVYTLQILDHNGAVDNRYPPIPNVFSKLQITAGALVAVACIDGEINPAIIGEVSL